MMKTTEKRHCNPKSQAVVLKDGLRIYVGVFFNW